MIKRLIALVFVCSFVFSSFSFNAKAATMPMPTKSLYHRLGGYDAIAAVVDDFIARLVTDPKLSRFFAGHSVDSLHRIRQGVVDLVCQVTGGPCYYTGRDMKTSHAGMGITEEDWQASVNHLVATLKKFKVPQNEQNELMGTVSSLKKDIVMPTELMNAPKEDMTKTQKETK